MIFLQVSFFSSLLCIRSKAIRLILMLSLFSIRTSNLYEDVYDPRPNVLSIIYHKSLHTNTPTRLIGVFTRWKLLIGVCMYLASFYPLSALVHDFLPTIPSAFIPQSFWYFFVAKSTLSPNTPSSVKGLPFAPT